MTEEQFGVLRELLENILEKLETIEKDAGALASAVDSKISRIRVASAQDYW